MREKRSLGMTMADEINHDRKKAKKPVSVNGL